MKILFSAGDFDKQLHATNKIVYNIAESLAAQGHDCIFAGISTFDNAETQQKGRLKTIRFNSSHPCDKAFLAFENFVRKSGLPREQAKKRFYFAHPLHTAALLYRYNISKKPLYSVQSYAKQVMRLAAKEKPDILVVSYAPFLHAYELVTKNSLHIPVIAYQLDPWGLYSSLSDDYRVKNIAEETALFDRCAKIVTTPVLLRQYSQHPLYQKYTDKMVALNFPNVKPTESCDSSECVFDFDKNTVNLLFCGIVHDEYRNPQIMLNSLKSLREKGFTSFKLHFLGTNESDTLRRFMTENDWVVHHDNVPLGNAFATMAQSDVLINIGNSYNNQVPSKIFDYFAFGKPVLNVEKIPDCPAREYFDRYPLAFTIKETDSCCCDTDSLAEFIQSAKNNCIEYTHIESIFSDCTLNYATELFCGIINDV